MTALRSPRFSRALIASFAVACALPALPTTTDAALIPAFARKYKVSCVLCHSFFPRLNAFGETFAGNGFEIAIGEPPTDTVFAGDNLLRLQREIPLAVRVDAYLMALGEQGDGIVATDLQTPWGIKLLTGGQVADKVSYYMYFYMSERGEVAGLEDAYLQFTDLFGSGVSVMAGQFQVSDPLYKRELRIEYEDYQIYRARVGDVRADLTYDRGVMALYSPIDGGDLTLQVVSGRGLSQASEDRRYDSDNFKNYLVRYSQELGPVRVGGFGYFGTERSDGINDEIVVWGPDATLTLGTKAEVNLQYMRRTDSNPFFLRDCARDDFRCDREADDPYETTLDAAMVELLVFPGGPMGRWIFHGLYNWIDTDRPALSLRLGEQESEPGFLEKYQTATLGATYLLKRNLKATGEVTYDTEAERTRLIFGFVTAF